MLRLSPPISACAVLFLCACGLSAPSGADPLAPLALAPHVQTAPQTHVLWNSTNGTMSLWTVADNGTWTHKEFGPYAGWTAKLLADGADGITNILWTHAPDGQVSLWRMDAHGSFTFGYYGPLRGLVSRRPQPLRPRHRWPDRPD